MTDHLQAQLDFIMFFYGLAFILLGVLCLALSRHGDDRDGMVRLIGLFGCVHGASEWLDMAALVAGDTPNFAILRAVVMTGSFLLLAEAARRAGQTPGQSAHGLWIYVPLLILIFAVGAADGTSSARTAARYVFGVPGALGVGLAILARGGGYFGASRPLLAFVGLGFIAYAVVAGVVVEPAPFWPASVVNQDLFLSVTGIPVQLVRGVIAAALAALIWAVWGRRLMQTVDSPGYTDYLKRQFVGVLAAMAVILVLGWGGTTILGGLYRENVEAEARDDLELLVSRFTRETAIADSMVKAVGGAPAVLALLTEGDTASSADARSVLELEVQAVDALRGLIVNRSGDVVLASGSRVSTWLGMPNQQGVGWFKRSIEGRATSELASDPITAERSYLTTYPIRARGGSIVGVAALQISLDALDKTLRRYDQSFFIIDARGVVTMTNRLEELKRTLWPRPDLPPLQVAERLGAPKRPPLLGREVFGGKWTEFNGRRGYVLREPIADGQWSLVLAVPEASIFASRLLGIVITLLVAIAALFYVFGRDRGVRERVERLRREELQIQTEDLARRAETDALTGLANRLKFNERLAEELARSRRAGRPFALIMCDVDYFKEINDVYGHPMGDQVLVQLSRTLAANVRQIDLAARWGGEEFAILLVDTDAVAAMVTAEKLRMLIARTVFGHVGSITSSFGVAQFCTDDSAETLLARADNALYRAKLNGRNRVELDTPVVEAAALAIS